MPRKEITRLLSSYLCILTSKLCNVKQVEPACYSERRVREKKEKESHNWLRLLRGGGGGRSPRRKIKTHRRQCKMSSSKKIELNRVLRQVVICLRPRNPYQPPYTHCIRVYVQYTYWHREGGESWTREKGTGAIVHKARSTVPNSTKMTDCVSSLETLINTCRKVPLQVNFIRWRHFALVST